MYVHRYNNCFVVQFNLSYVVIFVFVLKTDILINYAVLFILNITIKF